MLSKDAYALNAVPALAEGQRYFTGAGVAPTYFIDYPVLADDRAAAIFREAIAADAADFGVHLHPWVTPPFGEEINRVNSYAGNLPEEIERAKIRHMRDLMQQQLGISVVAYRAGRYGIGPNSYRILAEEGFTCDSSVRNLYDYRDDGGPDFRWQTHHPYFDGPDGAILEIPLTSLFVGRAGRIGRSVYGRLGAFDIARSLLARTGMMERVPLTPEGTPVAKACAAIDVAMDVGLRLLTMSFHSPSLAPGHTPYVRDAAELKDFYRWFDVVFNHCAKRGIEPARLGEIISAARAGR